MEKKQETRNEVGKYHQERDDSTLVSDVNPGDGEKWMDLEYI